MRRRDYLTGLGCAISALSGCTSDESTPTPGVKTQIVTKTKIIRKTPSRTATATPRERPETIFVGPNGSDSDRGTAEAPLASIQTALDRVQPGETIQVFDGVYREVLEQKRAGRPDEPITLKGSSDVVIKPAADNAKDWKPLLRIDKPHFHLEGMVFNGLANPDKPDDIDSYAQGIRSKPEWPKYDYLTNLKIKPDGIGNIHGAMVGTTRIKNAEIGEFRTIGPAGVQNLLGEKSSVFGEIVYLGSWVGGIEDYEWDSIDETSHIHVHHIDNSAGYPHAELVDAKPGTHDITIEYCTDSGGAGSFIGPSPSIGVKGHDIEVRWNDLRNGKGSGVRMGSWHVAYPEESSADVPESALDEGRDNSIYGNRITGFAQEAIHFWEDHDSDRKFVEGYGPESQKVICGNKYDGKTHGEPDKSCPDSLPRSDGIGYLGGNSPWT